MDKILSKASYLVLLAMISVTQANAAAAHDADDDATVTSTGYAYSDGGDDTARVTVTNHSYADVRALFDAYPKDLEVFRSIRDNYALMHNMLDEDKRATNTGDDSDLRCSIFRKSDRITRMLEQFGIEHKVPACESVYHTITSHEKKIRQFWGYAWPTQHAVKASWQSVMNALYDVLTTRIRSTAAASVAAGAGADGCKGAAAVAPDDTALAAAADAVEVKA